MNESEVQSQVRLEAAHKHVYLWRNNIGAGKLQNGSFVRWGLANDSAALNAVLKSADLIGIRRVLITQDMVGKIIGQFVSRECKPMGWHYSGTLEEAAQLKWKMLITDMGGDAEFVTGIGSI
jgi:hypothetical protein